jgi:hypothetical protein
MIMENLQAFILYKEKGIEAVMNIYPEYMEFVFENRDRSYAEVKAMVIKNHNDVTNAMKKFMP